MSEVTAPIMTDATGQSIDSKLNSLLGKMDNLAAAFQPNASGIVYSNTTSGLTGDDVQEAIDEMAADVSDIKSSLSQLLKIKYIFNGDYNIVNGYIEITDSRILSTDVIISQLNRGENGALWNGYDIYQRVALQSNGVIYAYIRDSQGTYPSSGVVNITIIGIG